MRDRNQVQKEKGKLVVVNSRPPKKKKRGINGIRKFYKVVLLFIKIICSLYCWVKQDIDLLKVYQTECIVYRCVLNRWLASTLVNATWLRGFQGLKWSKPVHLPDGKWWIWRHTSESSSKKHEYTGNKNAQSQSCHWEEGHLWERISQRLLKIARVASPKKMGRGGEGKTALSPVTLSLSLSHFSPFPSPFDAPHGGYKKGILCVSEYGVSRYYLRLLKPTKKTPGNGVISNKIKQIK